MDLFFLLFLTSYVYHTRRVHRYASCSNECFILALIYIDRLIQRNNFLLTELNVHRVVITAVLLAAKFFDDAYYNNAYYAKVGGVLVSEINGLEVDFLFRINFSLHATPDEFEKYRCELLSHSVVATSAVPTVEAHYAPAQVTPEIHSAPAAMDSDPFVPCCHATQLINATTMASQITPSPPSAAQMVEALVNAMVPDSFYSHHEYGVPSLHRTNSMPPLHKTASPFYQRVHSSSDPVHPRCSQPMSAMPQFPTADNAYGLMIDSRHMYPSQGNLVHHHHGTYARGPNVEVVGYVAAMSGAGL